MNHQAKSQLVVWWALWATFQTGIFFFYFFLGGMKPAPEAGSNSIAWLAGVAPFVISTLIRWLILPRTTQAQSALVLFVLGIALAEACCFLGLFIFPDHKLELFILSFLGILQYVPIFAYRYTGD